ncbi:unnamed protein product [Sphenostylis stenocarpa]|uniref:Uncharacterized protein n=1 Tax=Sphenostylis stenocarpa TaxID=92480 RepID=A0AA86RUI1_9FABA|nr:unnamed protein product [Sphenostylis stenocarpa]
MTHDFLPRANVGKALRCGKEKMGNVFTHSNRARQSMCWRESEREEEEEEEEEGIEYLRRERRKGFALKWRELAVVGDGQKWIDRMEERERDFDFDEKKKILPAPKRTDQEGYMNNFTCLAIICKDDVTRVKLSALLSLA